MEKIIAKPDKNGKIIIKLYGQEYEIVIDKNEKVQERSDRQADTVSE